ncbi:MAG: hypothetical protein R8L53_06250, partial [Mariprofundales bacterium]
MLLCCLCLPVQLAYADSVGQVQTTKFFAPETQQMLTDRFQQGQIGFNVGDVIYYIIQFTPVPNGSSFGAGGYVTDYIPTGTEVVGTWFVQPDGSGGYNTTPPPRAATMNDGVGKRKTLTYSGWNTTDPFTVAACGGAGALQTCNGSLAQVYADTGVFYSTDPRTAVFAQPSGVIEQQTNGYEINPTAETQLTPLLFLANGTQSTRATTHNLWDASSVNAFGATAVETATPNSSQALLNDTQGGGSAPFNAGSAVAGPDTGYTLDYTGSVGPWQRIRYSGSYIGSNAGGPINAFGAYIIGGTLTNLGRTLSEVSPLPS